MLANLVNTLWRGGRGPWRDDPRFSTWVSKGKPQWTYDEALQAIQIETRIAERFFELSPEQRTQVIELTAALIEAGEIPAPIRGGFIQCA